jgi:transcriptional antiterminator RfaH
MLRWYLIHTKPSAETLAEVNLDRQGYEVYLPRIAQAILYAGRWRQRIVALFPGYLFLRLNEGFQPLGPVQFTTGVANVVRFGSRYTVVPEHVIRDLRTRADPVSGLHRLNRAQELAPGTPIRIRTGPLDGLDGIFERVAGEDRIVVLLKLLGQSASACVPVDSISFARAV